MKSFFAVMRRPWVFEDNGALKAWYWRAGRLRAGTSINICFGVGFSIYRDCEGDWNAALQLLVVAVNTHFWWRA